MIKSLNRNGIRVENSILIANKGFDCKCLRRAYRQRYIKPNIKENIETERRQNGVERDVLTKMFAKKGLLTNGLLHGLTVSGRF